MRSKGASTSDASSATARVSTVARPLLVARLLGVGALVTPGLVCVALDVVLRGARIAAFDAANWTRYLAAVAQSIIVWGALLYATTTQHRALRYAFSAFFVVVFTLALGGQTYFFGQYHAYLTRAGAVFAANMIDSVRSQLMAEIGAVSRTQLPFLAIAVWCVWATRRVRLESLKLSRIWRPIAPLLFGCSLVSPVQDRRQQAATPDTLYLNAVGAFLGRVSRWLPEDGRGTRPRERKSSAIAQLTPSPHPARNVLLVITESVRADAVCLAADSNCESTPATQRALPNRTSFSQLRSLSSTTAVSVAVLWSGLLPTESEPALHSWPLLFDYARAAGWDTAYWTSQNLLFGNSRLWVKNLGARLQTHATALDPEADIDTGADEGKLADYVIEHLHELQEPYFAVVHLSNTHFPYWLGPGAEHPFVDNGPASLRARYQHAVKLQDQHLARIYGALRSSDAGRRTVILFTSDHGEAFREHDQNGHTLSGFDEEIHVPGFVDAPPETLTEAERTALGTWRNTQAFHIDIAPTVLDLVGVRQLPEIAQFARPLPGRSWLAVAPAEAPLLPLTNCTPLWSCAFENWGVIQGSRKLLARGQPMPGLQCFDNVQDPKELHPLPLADCPGMEVAFYRYFSRTPE